MDKFFSQDIYPCKSKNSYRTDLFSIHFSTIFSLFLFPLPTKERNSLVKKRQPDVSSILIRTIAQSDILLRLTATVVPTSSRIKGNVERLLLSSKFVSRSNGFEFTGCSLFLEFPQILIIPCVTRHRKSNDFWVR